MTKRKQPKKKRVAAIHWRDLPHARWDIEIYRRTRSASPDKAFNDARRLHLERLLEHHREVHGEYIAMALGEIIFELRVASEVYKAGLTEVNQRLAIRESEENLRYYAVEYALAPYAAACLRWGIQRYLEFAKIPLDRLLRLFDPLWPDLPEQMPRLVFQPEKASKSISELLESLVPDDTFQGMTKGKQFDTEGPLGVGHLQRKRVSRAAASGTSLSELLDLHRNEMWWIQHATFLWSGTLDEVAAQHQEVELEIYGRKLGDLERTDVDKLIDFYAKLKPNNAPIGDEDLLKAAQLAESLGLKPKDVLGKNGRETLNAINARRRQHAPQRAVNTISDVVREIKPVPGCGDRSLRAYFTKFLSDRLNLRSPRAINFR